MAVAANPIQSGVVLGIPDLDNETVWYKEKLTDDLTKLTTLGPASVSLGNPIIRKLFNEWGKGKWRSFFEHSTETQCKAAGAEKTHTCYICGYPIRNDDGRHALGAQCEHIIACVQLILLCGLAGEEWEDSIESILNCLGIDSDIKQEYKEWRKGIVGSVSQNGLPDDPAGEGGGEKGISYLYAHPACNSLKDNDQFIRIKFNPDGNITIVCTLPNYYSQGDGWTGCVKDVVPNDHPSWDPRPHIPPPMDTGDFTRQLLSSDCTGGNMNKIYSSICWKNIYWILCSLVGYNLILKTQVKAGGIAAAAKAISEGGTKTIEWREAVFAPWADTGGHSKDWTLGDELGTHNSILSNTQGASFTTPTNHPNGKGKGIDVYNTTPLMVDGNLMGIASTEEWIKHRADRIGQHLLPLIRNIQKPIFDRNSKSFGLISALVFAHRLDRKIKKEKDKFDTFEQSEISSKRPYVKDILSIKFQVDVLNLMLAETEIHNFEIAHAVAAASAPQQSLSWREWLTSKLSGVATGATTTGLRDAATSLGVTQIYNSAYESARGNIQRLGTLAGSITGSIDANQILALVACYKYGWVPKTDQISFLKSMFSGLGGGGQNGGMVKGREHLSVGAVPQMGPVAFNLPHNIILEFQRVFLPKVIYEVLQDLDDRQKSAEEWVRKAAYPDELEQFILNFGVKGEIKDDTRLKFIQPHENYAGNFTQYITTKREQITEKCLKAYVINYPPFYKLTQEKPEIFSTFSTFGIDIGDFLFDASNFLDVFASFSRSELPLPPADGHFLKYIQDNFLADKYPQLIPTAGKIMSIFPDIITVYNELLNDMIDKDDALDAGTLVKSHRDIRESYIIDMDYFSNFFDLTDDDRDEGEYIIMQLKKIAGIVMPETPEQLNLRGHRRFVLNQERAFNKSKKRNRFKPQSDDVSVKNIIKAIVDLKNPMGSQAIDIINYLIKVRGVSMGKKKLGAAVRKLRPVVNRVLEKCVKKQLLTIVKHSNENHYFINGRGVHPLRDINARMIVGDSTAQKSKSRKKRHKKENISHKLKKKKHKTRKKPSQKKKKRRKRTRKK